MGESVRPSSDDAVNVLGGLDPVGEVLMSHTAVVTCALTERYAIYKHSQIGSQAVIS
jgi:hypothetical protein